MPPDVTANTGATPTGAATTPAPKTTVTPTATTSTTSKGNAMSPSEFKNRLRGTSEQTFETETDAPDVVDPEGDDSAPETTFQAEPEETEALQSGTTEEDLSQETEEDTSWLEALKEYKQLHGLELVDLVKALAEGRLPDELHDIIKIKMKNGDEEWESPLSKARKEAMLHHDYTGKLQALALEKKEYYDDKNEFVGMLQNWKGNPEALLDGLERLEFPVLEAAKLLAKRHRELDAMTPRERELYEQKVALERELNKGKYEQRRNAESESKKQTDAIANKRSDFVSSTAKTLFDKHQVPMDERTWRVFLGKFKIISDSYPPGAEWTAEMVENAFEATHYDYQQALAKREKVQQNVTPPKQKQQFDSPAREAVAKLNTAPQPKKGQKGGAMTAKDFRKLALGR